jgi:hypothetical protein
MASASRGQWHASTSPAGPSLDPVSGGGLLLLRVGVPLGEARCRRGSGLVRARHREETAGRGPRADLLRASGRPGSSFPVRARDALCISRSARQHRPREHHGAGAGSRELGAKRGRRLSFGEPPQDDVAIRSRARQHRAIGRECHRPDPVAVLRPPFSTRGSTCTLIRLVDRPGCDARGELGRKELACAVAP